MVQLLFREIPFFPGLITTKKRNKQAAVSSTTDALNRCSTSQQRNCVKEDEADNLNKKLKTGEDKNTKWLRGYGNEPAKENTSSNNSTGNINGVTVF